MTDAQLPATMPEAPKPRPYQPKKPSRLPWALALLVLAVALAGIIFWGANQEEAGPPAQAGKPGAGQAAKDAKAPAIPPPAPSQQGPVVDVTPSEPGQPAYAPEAKEQSERKQPYGLDKSVDAVVRSDESIRLGDKEVSVQELERRLVVEQRGDVLEKPLKGGKITAWGVYAVRPGDSLWKIHYALLREYMASRGYDLPLRSDQPVASGLSSGVGKILKFAEHMVGVYNLKTGHMTRDLDLLEPGQKVVVFNLSEIFDQLAQVDPKELSGVMYDGRVLLFPAREGKMQPPPVQKQP
ncbi:MAG: hypothetical protein V1797_03415 [Pseudomonadota bacterium]